MSAGEIGVGVVGLGFMGRTHVEAWARARAAGESCRLVAVADPDPKKRSGRVPATGNLGGGGDEAPLFSPDEVRGHATPEELFADPSVSVVSLCTPTPTHVDLAAAALRAGKHVLCEKPVDLDPARIRALAAVAADAGRLCLPAMCMRFWPGWDWLAGAVASGRHGAVRSATFRRLGSLPGWSRDFYADMERSGGALVDLHVHDVDFVLGLFGVPDEVRATGNALHVTALYRYADGPVHVSAEGAWDQQPGAPFRMSYLVNFERATADFELGRETLLFLAEGGERRAVALEDGDGYLGEVRHLLAVLRGETPPRVDLEDAARAAELILRERAAL
ncbi:MAG: Gfo/Idh/MocA family oxidoreductase [Planctomycetota bacterium]